MKQMYRKIIFSILGAGGALGILLSIENSSYANEAADLTKEADFASEAYKQMDPQAQQAMVSGMGSINIQNLDLETALLAIQQERAKLLENQLQDQIKAVQERNSQITKLNEELAALNKELAKFPVNDTSDQKKALEKKITDLKGQIDSVSNSQQMDALRLQSLSNKRNEAFDTMTKFIKQMQDSRSSIIGNMR